MSVKGMLKEAVRSCGYEVRRVPKRWVHPAADAPGKGNGMAPPPPPPPGTSDPRGMLPHVAPPTIPLLPTTNADGRPVVPMTDEQRYWFDLKGWICLPGLLDAAELAAVREHVRRFREDRASLPDYERFECAGAAQLLLDHPATVGVLNEMVSYQPLATEDCYGFRFDGAFCRHKRAGEVDFDPHSGAGMYAFCGNSHIYQNAPGRVHAGLTRVVWELNEIGPGERSTLLLSGSHKAAYPRPPSTNDQDHPLYESYTCPAGSAIVFTESIVHSYGSRWSNPARDRLAIFICYNTVNSKWHRGGPSPWVIEALAPKRQTLFRGAWVDEGEGRQLNTYYSEENRAV
jgi:hypothetical protein